MALVGVMSLRIPPFQRFPLAPERPADRGRRALPALPNQEPAGLNFVAPRQLQRIGSPWTGNLTARDPGDEQDRTANGS
jgi:hypothetical protein